MVPAAELAERPIERRGGRPRSTSARELELIALDLFVRNGYPVTTVEMIASAAGVSRRTFFRYFDSKSDVLWSSFDAEVDRLRRRLAAAPADRPPVDLVREAVVAVNQHRAEDVAELRARIDLISSVPELIASASAHYDAWERAVIEFVATRSGQPASALFPLAVGRATLAVCRAAYERWASQADTDLTVYLDAALRAMTDGFRNPDQCDPGR